LHGESLLFPTESTALRPHCIGRGETCRPVKPACEHDAGPQGAGLPGEVGKNRLRHVLRQVRVAGDLAQCRGINQVDMPRHKLAESGFRTVLSITSQ